MTCILGIDPGSLITGFGLIDSTGNRNRFIACGCIRTPPSHPLEERLHTIYTELQQVIHQHHPEELAVEQVFMHRNAASALKLGHARGVALLAGAVAALRVAEYSPRTVKLAVVGSGGATKEQVQHMVRALLNIQRSLPADAADALAVALCHANSRHARHWGVDQ